MQSIAVERGFNCYQFQAVVGDQTVDVLASEAGFETGEGQPSHNGIPILFPFPNRIREGKYTWDGHDYQIPLSAGHPNAIHGFVYDRPWRVIEEGDNFVVGQFQLSVDALSLLEDWPSDFVIEVRYTVAGSALRNACHGSQSGRDAAALGVRDACVLQAAARRGRGQEGLSGPGTGK